MEEMTALDDIRQMLEEQQKRLLEKLDNQLPNSQRAFNPDRADLAVRYTQNQREALLIARAEQQYMEVESALDRIKNGTYGKCEQCGQEIHPARLETIPTTSFCIHCRGLMKKERK